MELKEKRQKQFASLQNSYIFAIVFLI